jgi:murein endopeptidase
VLLLKVSSALSQDPGTLNLMPRARSGLAENAAKELFDRKTTPLRGGARSIGSYNNGCFVGGGRTFNFGRP